MTTEELLGIKNPATEEALMNICLELAEIRKELQTIRSSLESSRVDIRVDEYSISHRENHG